MRRFIHCLTLAGALAAIMPMTNATTVHAASLSTTTTVSFEPARDRYPRGQWITLKAVVRDQYGNRTLPPGRVSFVKRSSLGTVTLGTVSINDDGVAKMSFQVPVSPHDDFVYIVAKYVDPWGWYHASSGEKRIPIGG